MRLILLTLLTTLACAAAAAPIAPPPYGKASQAYPFAPMTGGVVLSLGDNDLSAPIAPVGFSFNLFMQQVTSFRVGSDGYVLFGSGGQSTTPNHAAGMAVSPYWADLVPVQGSSEISWYYQSGVLIVQWLNLAQRVNGTVTQTGVAMQLVLNRSTGVIRFRYGTPGAGLAGAATAVAETVAISGPAGTPTTVITGLDTGYVNADGSVATWPADREISFLPNPIPIPPVLITTGPLSDAPSGTAWQVDFNAVGGAMPYHWLIGYPGGLPAGWTLNGSTGLLSVDASVAVGTHTFWIEVHDSLAPVPYVDLRQFTVRFVSPALVITTAPVLPAGTQGQAYTLQLAATGGYGSYGWNGAGLPAGFVLNAQGLLAATAGAAQPGVYQFTVSVTDQDVPPTTASLPVTLTIATLPVPLAITTTILPVASLNHAYAATLTAVGGDGNYAWDLAAGTLPPGIALSATGQISGTVSAGGTFDFTARVTDGQLAVATQPFTIVAGAPELAPGSSGSSAGCAAGARSGLVLYAVLALLVLAAGAGRLRARA